MASLSNKQDGLPTVNGTADRDSRFPTPSTDFKVYNKQSGFLERYNGTTWVSEGALGPGAGGVFHPATYGLVDLTGNTDIGPAVQLAINAALAAGGGVVQLPAGVLKWDTRVTGAQTYTALLPIAAYAPLTIRGAGRGATVIRPSLTRFLDIGDPTYPVKGITLEDFSVRIGAHLGYANGLIRFRWLRNFTVRNIDLLGGPTFATAYDYSAYLLELDTAYEGVVDNVEAHGYRVYPFELNSVASSGEQKDTITFTNVKANQCQHAGFVRTGGGGDWHGLLFHSFKHVYDAVNFPDPHKNVYTTVSGAHSAGATTLVVASATDLPAGAAMYLVGKGSTAELVEVTSRSGTTLTLASHTPLRYDHANGEVVLRGAISVSLPSNCFDVQFHASHVESVSAWLWLDGTGAVKVFGGYSSAQEVVAVVGNGVKDLLVIGVAVSGQTDSVSSTVVGRVARLTTAGDGAAHARWCFIGPFHDPNTAIQPTVLENTPNRDFRWRVLNKGTTGEGWLDEWHEPSGATDPVVQMYSGTTGTYNVKPTGEIQFVRLQTDSTTAATVLGSVTRKLAIVNTSGVTVGYIPLYDAIT